ncbi:MAG: PepSY domain-containing protein [Pseudomonadota bacterium]
MALRRRAKIVMFAATVALVPATAIADDRPPTPEELVEIEKSLRAAGYVTWEEIELDDGLWEVDDAMKDGDNREFDLKLHPQTYEIIVERED